MESSGSEPVYSIGAVARMLNLTTTTLRSWEDRYGVVRPARSAGGQRVYSRDQVDQLRFVQRLMAGGLPPADAHRILAKRLADGMTLVPEAPDGSSASILLAERDTYTAQMIDYLLRTEGYEVTIALDAQDARQLYAETAPSLVVVELVISGGVGLQLCRDLAVAGARILAVSSVALGDAALAAGAEAFLQKPLEPLQTLSTIKDLLGTSALARGGDGSGAAEVPGADVAEGARSARPTARLTDTGGRP
ncbi:MAG TPA: MerR family transcriptional regulator [Acidimicrobiales bacterium]